MKTMRLMHDTEIVTERVDALVIAGWTGRDRAGVDHHIRELEALGISPPSTVPLFYRVSAALLAPAAHVEAVGTQSSGEAEPMLVQVGGRLWLGVASDHTDRALEAHSVALSKQICAKPCAAHLWPLDEALATRLDALELRSWIADDVAGDDWTLYQEGTLGAIRPLIELLEASPVNALSQGTDTSTDTSTDTGTNAGTSAPADTVAMLCGTLPAIGGVRPAGAFRMELRDAEQGRSLQHAYGVRVLPAVD